MLIVNQAVVIRKNNGIRRMAVLPISISWKYLH
jgi:hypothetical protein